MSTFTLALSSNSSRLPVPLETNSGENCGWLLSFTPLRRQPPQPKNQQIISHSCCYPAIRCMLKRVLLTPESSSTSSTRFAKHPLWLKPSRNLENHEKLTLMGYISFLFHGTSKKFIDLIVPEGRQSLPNLISTKQVRLWVFVIIFRTS